jgi:hypothetical protein
MAHDNSNPSHVVPSARHPDNEHVPVLYAKLLATNVTRLSMCLCPMSPPSRSTSFRTALSAKPKSHNLAIKNSPVFSKLSLSVQGSLRGFFFTSTTALRQTSLRKMQEECGSGVGFETRSKRRGLWRCKLAYLKWAVKKPATHPSPASAGQSRVLVASRDVESWGWRNYDIFCMAVCFLRR